MEGLFEILFGVKFSDEVFDFSLHRAGGLVDGILKDSSAIVDPEMFGFGGIFKFVTALGRRSVLTKRFGVIIFDFDRDFSGGLLFKAIASDDFGGLCGDFSGFVNAVLGDFGGGIVGIGALVRNRG